MVLSPISLLSFALFSAFFAVRLLILVPFCSGEEVVVIHDLVETAAAAAATTTTTTTMIGMQGDMIIGEDQQQQQQQRGAAEHGDATLRRTAASTTKKKTLEEWLDWTARYGRKQEVGGDPPSVDLVEATVQKMDQYLREIVWQQEKEEEEDGVEDDHKDVNVRDNNYCQNRHENCLAWAMRGECDHNPSYMHIHCAPVCQTCHRVIKAEEKCPINPRAPVAWQPGDLHKMFERITTDPFYQIYHPTILSQPEMIDIGGRITDNDSPWIITLDNVLTPEECATMIELGIQQGFQRSLDSDQSVDGSISVTQSQHRTSSNTWCLPPCSDHPTAQKLMATIENITGIADTHSEYLQLLRYDVGQFYGVHHDYSDYHVQLPQGPRILTLFLYLNEVAVGGGTRFTALNVTVLPHCGRAVLWPSVQNDHPWTRDLRTLHEALVVEQGVKFGANAWLHQRDFKTPFWKECSE